MWARFVPMFCAFDALKITGSLFDTARVTELRSDGFSNDDPVYS